jgi:replication fork clamp-binding protein CrfC
MAGYEKTIDSLVHKLFGMKPDAYVAQAAVAEAQEAVAQAARAVNGKKDKQLLQQAQRELAEAKSELTRRDYRDALRDARHAFDLAQKVLRDR